jgi:hypothetical protein
MKISIVLAALTPAIVMALPAYMSPGESDKRGPCPGLNTLANHGYLNRNGSGIMGDNILSAGSDVYSIDESTLAPFLLGLTPLLAPDGSFNLDQLYDLAHDMSLVHVDGDNPRGPQENLVDALLATSSDEFITIDNIITHYIARYTFSKQNNPDFVFPDIFGVGGEAASLLAINADADMTKAPKSFIRSFLLDERLPDDFENRKERNLTRINLETLDSNMKKLMGTIGPLAEPRASPGNFSGTFAKLTDYSGSVDLTGLQGTGHLLIKTDGITTEVDVEGLPEGVYNAHLHNKACADGGGGHYQNPERPGVIDDVEENWPITTCGADSMCTGTASNAWIPLESAVLSIVVHDTPAASSGSGAKMICADLQRSGADCVICPQVQPTCDPTCKDCAIEPQTCFACAKAVCYDGNTTGTTGAAAATTAGDTTGTAKTADDISFASTVLPGFTALAAALF